MATNFPPDTFIEYDGTTGVPPSPPLWGTDMDHSTAQIFSGDSSIAFAIGSPGYLATKWFPVSPTKGYTAKMTFYGVSPDRGFVGVEYADKDLTTPYTAGWADLTTGNSGWTQAAASFSPPDGMAWARILFGSFPTSTAVLYVDSITITPTKFYSRVRFGPLPVAIPTATWTVIGPIYPPDGYDPMSVHTSGGAGWTIKASGDYAIDIECVIGHTLANGLLYRVRILKNGVTYHTFPRVYSSGQVYTNDAQLMPFAQFVRGDVITFELWHNGGSNVTDLEGHARLLEML